MKDSSETKSALMQRKRVETCRFSACFSVTVITETSIYRCQDFKNIEVISPTDTLQTPTGNTDPDWNH